MGTVRSMAKRTGTAPTAATNRSWASVKAETIWVIRRDCDGWFLFAGDTIEWTPSPVDEVFTTTKYQNAMLHRHIIRSKSGQDCHVVRVSKTITTRAVLVDADLGELTKYPFFKHAFGWKSEKRK